MNVNTAGLTPDQHSRLKEKVEDVYDVVGKTEEVLRLVREHLVELEMKRPNELGGIIAVLDFAILALHDTMEREVDMVDALLGCMQREAPHADHA